jgi:hypothetical protein
MHCPYRGRRHSGRKPAPPSVRCRYGAGAAVGDEKRDTIGHADGNRQPCIVGQHDVGVGWLARPPRDEHTGSVDLTDTHELSGLHADRRRHITPGVLRRALGLVPPKTPQARGEHVRSDRFERRTDECRTAGRVNPAE